MSYLIGYCELFLFFTNVVTCKSDKILTKKTIFEANQPNFVDSVQNNRKGLIREEEALSLLWFDFIRILICKLDCLSQECIHP